MGGFFSRKNLVLMMALLLFAVVAISAAGGKYDFPIAKILITNIVAPIDSFFSGIGNAVRQSGVFVGSIMSTYEENQRLQKEIFELKRAKINSLEIEAENQRLRELLNFKATNTQFVLLPARVVGFNPNGLVGNILIGKGKRDGVEKEMPVVTSQGLVGSVIDVYSTSSRVQLLLHPQLAVGGIVQRSESRVAGIVSGNVSTPRTPNLMNLARDADVLENDIILTSGFGGIYPKGIMIGTVAKVINAEGGLLKYAVINPSVNFEQLEEVMVITNAENYSQELVEAHQERLGEQ